MLLLKQSTARNRTVLLVSSTDHLSGLAGATLTITASKDGGAFASITPVVTDLGNGLYKLALTSAHTDTLGDLALHITATGADPADVVDQVIAVDLNDAVAFGLSRLDAAVSSRMATFTLPANFASLSITAAGLVDLTQAAADKVWSTATRALTDKVGFALSAAGVQAIWDALTSALTTVGSIGKLLVDNINATISSRMATFSLPANFASLAITAGGAVTVGTNNDKTGYGLSAAAVQAVWDALTANLTTVGSIGKRLADDIDATISSRQATVTFPANFSSLAIDANGRVDLSKWLGVAVNALVAGRVDSRVGAMAADTIDSGALASTAVEEIFGRGFSAADNSLTFDQIVRVMVCVLAAKASGFNTGSPVWRNLADTGNVVSATVDATGRLTVTLTP